MEAIVLVGGQGTRLRPLTLGTPKPMLPFAGVPFLTHQLARAQAAGVRHVVLATSYRPEVFEQHFGDGSDLGIRLDYVSEDEPLGTAGGIRHVSPLLDSEAEDPVVVLNGDILSGHDVAAQIAMHRSTGAGVTLHLVEVSDPRAFGCVPTDETGRVTAFLEKSPNPPTNQVNAGCYVFRRDVIDRIPAGRPVSVERETFPGLLAEGTVVMGYVDTSYWLDVGTPAAFIQGSADVVRGIAPTPVLPTAPGESLVLAGAAVDPTASVVGGSVVGSGATVGAGVTIDGSVVLDGARIESDSVVRDSVVGCDVQVGDGCQLTGAVIGDRARLGARNELTRGARVWPDVQLPDVAIRFSTDA